MARPGLTQHRKFRRLERVLNSHVVARGVLETMWDVCYQNGDPFLGDSDDVEAAAHWDGEPGKLTKALVEAGGGLGPGFIEEAPGRSGQYQVHDLYHHAPDYVRKRRTREEERRAKTDPVRNAALSDQSVTGHRQPSLSCQTGVSLSSQSGVDRTPAPAPLIKTTPSSSEQKGYSDQVDPPTPKKTPKEPSREASRLAALLKAEILRNKADFRIPPRQERQWAITADRMLRLDQRTEEQIATLIRWVQQDEFWASNVLSMDKLRAKFDELEMKRQREVERRKKTNGNGFDSQRLSGGNPYGEIQQRAPDDLPLSERAELEKKQEQRENQRRIANA